MKNRLLKVLAILSCLALSAGFAACGGNGDGGNSSHNSSSGSEISSSLKESSESLEDSSFSSEEVVGKNGLSFASLTFEDGEAYVKVPNATETFSFKDEVTARGESDFIVSLDEYGFEVSLTKIVPLEVGDNLVCVFETIDGEIVNTYKVTIRRRAICTVYFNTDGGTTVESQTVEEDGYITETEMPVRGKDVFLGWENGDQPIVSSIWLKAKWDLATYTITYDLAGGEKDTENVKTCTYADNITLLDGVATCRKFLGWYDENDNKVTKIEKATSDIRLTAKWKNLLTVEDGVVTDIVWWEFENETRLEFPSVYDGQEITAIGENILKRLDNITEVVIPDSVISINEGAFRCAVDFSSNLTSVIFGENSKLKTIGKFAFSRCKKLENIKLPDSVTSIGVQAFWDCESLSSMIIPDGVTTIEKEVFAGCEKLTTVVIPDSVTSIEDYAFV